ncbi:response regulator transcription factor [Curtobacterium sp. MCPF17_050]|uniref:response regulator transcription factor n=1 Tax=Curtobacterium sp. MCPF17_050 TaxID=2175664 RepID=UPI0021ABD184|nr:response regulator transcription factor [Curtobacterium sp. MCPF17_050]WIB15027.1 response regulator transcription factor [Curtobacterium sp. MCPF17_050]
MTLGAGAVPAALRIVLAEDSVLLREGTIRLLEEAGFTIGGSYGDAGALLAELATVRPDVAVLDVRMPPTFRDEGLRAAIRIRTEHPEVAVLLLSQYAELDYARELLATGEHHVGYLLKDRISSIDDLRDDVARVARGGLVLDPQIVQRLITRRTDPVERLTPRERDVLRLIAEGQTNQAVAHRLRIAVASVEKHISSIFTKLDLEPTPDAHRRVLAVLAWLRGGGA